ncbi:BH1482 [Halalkalibacterium halodurans C-125]|uniref:BH1482 protein n=1 Tax=Halalkalibacterium halodurans (strain ATCC BAA-125 / DSM 18197 / FERM 7344 / JCM 9153 / C-125) TaxID=272558 RepID=Q9KCT7_HALH5|nr:cyclic-di-AMP-binding protein CbpB [Halalkalibacterium halodurans]BAB05201.1 BH1482 [Halalkalibacterium halodurans C-125]
MQNLIKQNIMDNDLKELVIPFEKVAHVHLSNPLEHALLVLIKSGYTAIPVLDEHSKLHGVISKSLILDALLGVERIEMERLAHLVVKDVMNPEIPTIHHKASFSRALKVSIAHPFICILDDDGSFLGILTRSTILSFINRQLQHPK